MKPVIPAAASTTRSERTRTGLERGSAAERFAENLGRKLDSEARTARDARSDAWLARARTDEPDAVATGDEGK